MFAGKKLMSAVLVAMTLISGPATIRAEIAPVYRAKMQNEAQEALQVEITKVDAKRTRGKDFTAYEVCAVAKVISVTRSASGLRPGSLIEVQYDTSFSDFAIPGSSPIDVLESGKTMAIYVHRDGKVYRPSARNNSFVEIKDTSKSTAN